MDIEYLIKQLGVKIRKTGGGSYYDPQKNAIYMNSFYKGVGWLGNFFVGWPSNKKYLLYHELGHAFFAKKNLSSSRRARGLFGSFGEDDYQPDPPLICNMLNAVDDEYITAYAAEHPLEDFAECFAHLLAWDNEIPDDIEDELLEQKFKFVQKKIRQVLGE